MSYWLLQMMETERKDNGAVKIGGEWFNFKTAKFTNYRKIYNATQENS